MSDDTDSDQRAARTEPKFRRRTFLAASGALGVSTLFGVSSATPGNGSNPGNGSGDNPARGPNASGFTRHEITEDGLGNAQTDTPPFSPRLVTYEGRQYYAYWTHAGKLVVAARDLPDGEWTQNHTDVDIGQLNGHWTPAVGIGPDGHVFVCYNTRGSPPTWRRSTNPADITSFGPEQEGMTGQNEYDANYPTFTRLDDGTLLFSYRQGWSGDGDWMLNRWNGDAEEWEPLQHPLISRHFEGKTYNAYPWNSVQSTDGTLHYFFCWRGTGGVQTNQQLSYAQSRDGGETWTRSDGTEYDLPITKGSVEVVDPIEPGSNLINQGWSAYHPETSAPHVAYYRDDDEGNTQIFHAHLDDGQWEIEAATDRDTNIGLGGPGVVASPIGRMGIVVGDDGDVHMLTRDFQRGGWPLLIEKLDGEWTTSVLYKRNMTWSDMHIDRERWEQDRVLSYIDHRQNVGGVPWSSEAMLGITDVDLDDLNRETRTVDSWEADDGLTTYASTNLASSPVSASGTSFQDTSAALALSETTVPATPIHARVHADFDLDAGDGRARVKIQGEHGTTYGTPVSSADGDGTVTSEWTMVPQGFRAGFVNVQVSATAAGETTQVTDTELEVGYVDPTPYEDTVAPQGGGR